MEEGEFLQKTHKKFRDVGENRTHDPPSSNSDALTTELREALWRVGSKLNYCLASPCTGTLNNDDGYGSENVTKKRIRAVLNFIALIPTLLLCRRMVKDSI